MNKAQKRPMLHKVLSMILALVMVLSLLPVSALAAATDTASNEYEYNIMFLDCGRKYYSVDSIKKFIDNASVAGFNYIQLAVGNDGMRFLLDDMSLTVNGTEYKSEAVRTAIHDGNEKYYNFDVDELTQTEMDTIIAYANSKGMGVIPCVNTPGHMDAILAAATKLTGVTCAYNGSARTIDVTNDTAVAFTKAFLQKYIEYFAGKGCRLFNMGADEYANDIYKTGSMGFGNLQSSGKYGYYVKYVNAVAQMIKAAGMTPMAFNDGIYFNGVTGSGTFDTGIIVCYWSNGWSGYTPMPAATLAGMGFKLVNTNGSYYWVLGKSDAQCSADKAKGFNKNTFPADTNKGEQSNIENPKGSMFCIWADYPGAETEASVISKTKDTIAAFGSALPKVAAPVVNSTVYDKTGTTEATKGGDAVSVTAPGLTKLMANAATAPAIENVVNDNVAAYDVTPSTDTGEYTNAGTVSIKIPDGWNENFVRGFVVNDDNSVDTIPGTVKDGYFTFTAPHFSVMGIYEISEDAAYDEEQSITVPVGGTKNVTVKGDVSGTYVTGDQTIATVTTKYSPSSAKALKDVTAIESGKQYLLINTRSGKALTNTNSGSYLELDGAANANNTTNLWTITKNGNYYIVQDSADKYLSVGSGTASVVSNATYCTLTYDTTNSCWDIANSSKDQHLNHFGGGNSTNAGGYSSYDEGSRWRICEITGGEATTEITFTGNSVGTTSVIIGNVKYNITVTVTPLKLESWITNSKILNGTTSQCITSIEATGEVVSSNGIDVTAKVPNKLGHESREVYYWQCRLLDKTSTVGGSTSGSDEQTTAGGDDDTNSGVSFTKVRYYEQNWQVLTENNEWVTVDNSKNQLVAYYKEFIQVTDEVSSYAADWGKRGDGSNTGEGTYLNPNAVNTISYQVVYEDNITNPTGTSAADLKSKTLCYGFNDGDRGVGTIMLLDSDEYEIYKVTAEKGTMTGSSTGAWNPYTVNSFTWNNDAITVWDEENGERDAAGEVIIRNSTSNPSTDGIYKNLYWSKNNEAILLRVYVRAKVTEDSLTVHYIDSSNNKTFYSYNIAVAEGTYFKQNIALDESNWKNNLNNSDVKNIKGVTQWITPDLSKMPEIGAQYRYAQYKCVNVVQDEGNCKNVHLYYTFSNSSSFVVDFGLPLQIPLNKLSADLDNASINGVTVTGAKFGTTEYAGEVITYTPTKAINGEEKLSVEVSGRITYVNSDGQTVTQNGTVTFLVNIIPASTVYYEDSFASFANGTGAAADAKWSNINDKDETVAENRTYPAQALEALGADGNNVYGYDSAYDETNSATYSMGSAHKVTVTSGMVEKWNNDSAWPTATFTFKGTGFDIISLTDNTSGAIMVSVYEGKDTSAKSVKNYLVDNYYGYKYDSETKTWSTTNSTDRNALYQIPVIKVNSLPYGEYTVVIKAFYNGAFDHTTSKTEYSFWLDAIRVYDPMGESGNSYYAQDGEGWPQYIKLRDTIAAAGNDLGYSLFIDGAENADIATYANYGPNNEVYLASGQAISFKIPANSNIASVQIGAKAPNGNAKMNVSVNDTSVTSVLLTDNCEIKTATEMYYKIAENDAAEKTITITNSGVGILSLTNLKITYSSERTVELVAMSNKEKTQAVMAVRALFAAPEPVVEPFAPERFEAKWNSVRKGQTATLTVKASTDVEAITVNGVTVDSYKTRTERTGILWWAQKVEYREFTYSTTANESADYTVCAVNAEGVASELITATLTVKPAQNSGWWNNWWNGIFDKWF